MTEPNSPPPPYPVPPPLPPDAAGPPAMAQPLPYAAGNFPVVYISARPRAKGIVVLSWVMVSLAVVMVWPIVYRILAWRGVMTGNFFVTEEDLITAEYTLPDLVGMVLGVVYMAVALASFIVWLIWVHRTYANLRPLGADGLGYSPGWAVGYYFIPILNLFRPYQVMRETWQASDPTHAGGTDWRRITAPALLGWWWTLRLVTYIAWKVMDAASVAVGEEDAAAQVGLAVGELALIAAEIVLLLIVIRVARQLTEMQDARAQAMRMPFPAPASPAEWVPPAAGPQGYPVSER